MTTVAELIAMLSEYPPETTVLAWDGADYCPDKGPPQIEPHYVWPASWLRGGGLNDPKVDESTIVIRGGL